MAVESSAGTDMGADADTDTDGLLEDDVQFAGDASKLPGYVHSGTRIRDRYRMEDGRHKTCEGTGTGSGELEHAK